VFMTPSIHMHLPIAYGYVHTFLVSEQNDWRVKVADAVRTHAVPVETEPELITSAETPWPTPSGPFWLVAHWLRAGGRMRLAGLDVKTFPTDLDGRPFKVREFAPLTAEMFRMLRIGEIGSQLLSEHRAFFEILDDPTTGMSDGTRRKLEAGRDRAAALPPRGPGRPRQDDEELLRFVGQVFDAAAAGGRPVQAVRMALAQRPGRNYDKFREGESRSISAHVSRLIRRSRDLGYLQTPPLTRGRISKENT
jgi:hypothetical protein